MTHCHNIKDTVLMNISGHLTVSVTKSLFLTELCSSLMLEEGRDHRDYVGVGVQV